MSDAPPPASRPAALNEVGAIHALINAVQTRIMGGLILALPIVLTFWIVYWLYSTVKQIVLDPTIWAARYLLFGKDVADIPAWVGWVSPVIAIISALAVLYFLGLFVSSRLQGAVDWVMFRLPVITTIYKALRNVFQSLDTQLRGGGGVQRVVLVEFPHPGTRAIAFVTNTLRDASTGKTILCVYVMTGLVPPAGFTLFVPEERVVDTNWSANQALQAILSGGMTAPSMVRFGGDLASVITEPAFDPIGTTGDPKSRE
jgi:uncharacterized membrane protein